MIFLAVPLLWLLSTSFKDSRELEFLHPHVHPEASDLLQLHRRALAGRPRPLRAEQPQGGGDHGGPDDARRAPRRLRARAHARLRLEVRPRLHPRQPDVPVDPDHHPAVPGAARPAPDEHPLRPDPRLPRLVAAVHPLDAPELHPQHPPRPGGGGGRRRRPPDPDRHSRRSRPCSRRVSSSRCSSRSSRPGTSSSSRSSCFRARARDPAGQARAVRRDRRPDPARPPCGRVARSPRSRASCSSRSCSAG